MPTLHFDWQEIASGSLGPGKRSRHCLAYDRQARAAVLFSGLIWKPKIQLLADTWELRGHDWSPAETAAGPAVRHRAAMIYDGNLGASVLFGGQGDRGFATVLGDTWIYQKSRWQEQQPSSWRFPSGRCGHCFAFDERLGAGVLFGGIGNNDATLGDTWIFDGTWHPVRGPGPPARRYAGFAYDPALEGCLLYGGSFDDWGWTMMHDAWLFRHQHWLRLGDRFAPDERDDHGMAYHHGARLFIMLEGVNKGEGILFRTSDGWHALDAPRLLPRRQCTPMVYADHLNGLVMHGGEVCQGGEQIDATLLLCLRPDSARQVDVRRPIEPETLVPSPILLRAAEPNQDEIAEENIESAHAFLVWAVSQRVVRSRNGCLGSAALFIVSLAVMPWIPINWAWYWITLYVTSALFIHLMLWSEHLQRQTSRWCRQVLIPLAKEKGVPFDTLLAAVRRFDSLDAQRKKELGDIFEQRQLLIHLLSNKV